MSHRRIAIVAYGLLLFTSAQFCQAQAAPNLTSAVSRKTHGAAGTFDVLLPPDGSGIECRSVAGGMALVMTFDQPVTAGSASVTTGAAAINGAPVFSGSTMTVNLAGVGNGQAVTVALSQVTSSGGGVTQALTIPFRILQGDVNADGTAAAGDIFLTKLRASQTTNGSNFRSDINCDGSIAAGDVFLVKAAAASSVGVAGGATTNTAPTVTTVADQTRGHRRRNDPGRVHGRRCRVSARFALCRSDFQQPDFAAGLGHHCRR